MALHTEDFQILSLCAGIAGLDIGLKLAIPTARTVCYVEREATAAALLAARFADGCLDEAPIWSDLRTFDAKQWRGKIHCVVAGYPCQPFSAAGKRRGRKDPRHLWPEVARIIRECEPEFVLLENVSNHLRLGFREVAQELRRMGYRCKAGEFSAEEVGTPHLRKRVFALAERESGGCGELRESPGIERFLDRRGTELAYGESTRREARIGNTVRTQQKSGARSLARSGSASDGELENASRHGRDGRAHEATRPSFEGSEVADTRRGLVSLPGGRAQGRDGARPAGAELEHANGAGLCGKRVTELRPHVDEGCEELADARHGLQSAEALSKQEERDSSRPRNRQATQPGRRGSALSNAGSSRLPPPGPDDLERWAELLSIYPEIEPAIRRDADGLSSRVDRLRGLGNGVVPLVAAFAFLTLASAFVRVEHYSDDRRLAA